MPDLLTNAITHSPITSYLLSVEVLAVPKNMKLLAIPLFELYDNAARYVQSCVCCLLFASDNVDADTGPNFLPSLISSLGASHILTSSDSFVESLIICRYNFIYQ